VWSQAGSTTGGLNYYRANHRNPPFNDRHPAWTIPHSWSANEVTAEGEVDGLQNADARDLGDVRTPRFCPVTSAGIRLHPDDSATQP
jgi:hypothetical protein